MLRFKSALTATAIALSFAAAPAQADPTGTWSFEGMPGPHAMPPSQFVLATLKSGGTPRFSASLCAFVGMRGPHFEDPGVEALATHWMPSPHVDANSVTEVAALISD